MSQKPIFAKDLRNNHYAYNLRRETKDILEIDISWYIQYLYPTQ